MLIFIEIAIVAFLILSVFISPILTFFLLLLFLPVLLIQPKDWYRMKTSLQNLNLTSMRAAVHDLSSPSGFKLEETYPMPKYSPNQVVIKVMAAAINPVDYKLIFAKIPFLRWLWPKTVGRDISGVIIESGSNVAKFKVGDRIYGKPLTGALQEYATADMNEIAMKPERT